MALDTWSAEDSLLVQNAVDIDVELFQIAPLANSNDAVLLYVTTRYGSPRVCELRARRLIAGSPPSLGAEHVIWSGVDSTIFGAFGAYDILSVVPVPATEGRFLVTFTANKTFNVTWERYLLLIEVGDTITVVDSLTETGPGASLPGRLIAGAGNTFLWFTADTLTGRPTFTVRIADAAGGAISVGPPGSIPTSEGSTDAFGGAWCNGSVGVLIPDASPYIPFTVTTTAVTFGTPAWPSTGAWSGNPQTYENFIVDGPELNQFIVHVYHENESDPEYIKLAIVETNGATCEIVQVSAKGHYDSGGFSGAERAWSPRALVPGGQVACLHELVRVSPRALATLTLSYDVFGTERRISAPTTGVWAQYDTNYWDRVLCRTLAGYWTGVTQALNNTDDFIVPLVVSWHGLEMNIAGQLDRTRVRFL